MSINLLYVSQLRSIALISRIPPFLPKFILCLLAVESLQNPHAVDVARGITERWPVLACLDGFFGSRYGNKDCA